MAEYKEITIGNASSSKMITCDDIKVSLQISDAASMGNCYDSWADSSYCPTIGQVETNGENLRDYAECYSSYDIDVSGFGVTVNSSRDDSSLIKDGELSFHWYEVAKSYTLTFNNTSTGEYCYLYRNYTGEIAGTAATEFIETITNSNIDGITEQITFSENEPLMAYNFGTDEAEECVVGVTYNVCIIDETGDLYVNVVIGGYTHQNQDTTLTVNKGDAVNTVDYPDLDFED